MAEPVRLAGGTSMPSIGLGTWQLTGDAASEGVAHALRLGYRMIDTSGDYGNQPRIAEALRAASVPRDEIFLVTKVEEDEDPHESARQKVAELDAGPVDLCLLHRPPARGAGEELWEGLLRAKADGLAREVGVSNYSTGGLDRLAEATGEMPAVNQVEWSPFGHSEELREHAAEHGIVIQAYCPLTRGKRLDDGTLRELAARHGRTPAQVLLRWSIQSGAVPLPKAASPDHREENLGALDFELPAEDVEALSALNGHYSALAGLPYV